MVGLELWTYCSSEKAGNSNYWGWVGVPYVVGVAVAGGGLHGCMYRRSFRYCGGDARIRVVGFTTDWLPFQQLSYRAVVQ